MNRLSCVDAMERFFAYLDRALAGEALDDLEAHLKECLACCDKLAFSGRLDRFVRDRLPEPALPGGLEARVRQALERATGGA
jgi:hypothetical protein